MPGPRASTRARGLQVVCVLRAALVLALLAQLAIVLARCASFTAPSGARVTQLVRDEAVMDRRTLALLLGSAASLPGTWADPAEASEVTKVVVAGATGQTGRRIVERLSKTSGVQTVGCVRDIAKAKQTLAESSVQIRGAMIEQVGSIDTAGVELKSLDVTKDSVAKIAETFKGANSLVIATGFVPGNPFSMNAEAKAVDNVGTKLLVDAAKQAGVGKVVLVSSILTNGRAWGQENSPGFQITNAFGQVLDEKLVAEKYLRASGLDYTIVRPGGLKASKPSGNLLISGEDTLNTGEISRDLVADVVIASLSNGKASNKVVEIVEDDKAPASTPAEWFA